MAPQRHREWELAPPWDALSYRAIEMKIGEELRERYEPPPGLPDQLLTLLMKLERPTLTKITEKKQEPEKRNR
jgi:hypothetical protein